MCRKRLSLIACVTLCLTAGNLWAADPWRSAQALPKDPGTLMLRGNATRPGGEVVGSAYLISWPARVQKVDGQWILVGDTGGYTVPPLKGWVRKDDMLCIRDDGESTGEDPSQYYSNKMLETTDPAALAGLVWLRGLYWESQQETQIAARDYSAAIRGAFGQSVDPTLMASSVIELFRPEQGAAAAQEAINRFPGLPDAYLRLARLSAKSAESGQSAVAELNPASIQSSVSQHWKTYFACADALFRMRSSMAGTPTRMPALDTDWADALAADYQRLLAVRTASEKKVKTSMISHRMQAGDTKAAAPAAGDQSTEIEAVATQADALYRNALAANPSWSSALLGRGKLLMTRAKALSNAKGTKPADSQALMMEAAQQYTLAIQLEPKSRQAFRGRAEAYQTLAGHPQMRKRYADRCHCLSQAAQSADTASQLGRDRDPACLQLLAEVIQSEAEIYNELKAPKNAANLFKQASYYWQEAAACPNADRASIQDKMTACRRKLGEQQTLVAESSRALEEAPPEPKLPFYVPGSNLFGNKSQE